MAHIFTIIPTLTHTPNPQNPHNLPAYLSLWEIMINQRFTPEYLEEEKKAGDMEEFILDLLQTLYNTNSLYITSPLTGEILYHYNTTTGEEYKEEGFALLPSAVQKEVGSMMIHSSGFNSPCFGNLGEVFAAYIQTIRPHAHREPLRAILIGTDGKKIYDAPALNVLEQIQRRIDDGVCYNCETDLTQQIPGEVTIKATCSYHFWWFGHEPRKFEDCYDSEKGYFDLYPHINPFGTDFSRGISMTTIVDRKTGRIMQDKDGRNLAVYGYIKWSRLASAALELYEKGVAFDFCENGVPCDKLAHIGPKGCLWQNPKTGKWRAAWK